MVPDSNIRAGECPRGTILVVEDEALIRITLAEALRDLRITVVEASTADEAWEFLTSGGRVDLVFTDHRMPGSMTGSQLAERIREHYPSIEVLMTSGHFHSTGPIPVVRKPYSIFEVSAVPDEWQEFTDLDAQWSRGGDAEKNAVRARIDEIQPAAS